MRPLGAQFESGWFELVFIPTGLPWLGVLDPRASSRYMRNIHCTRNRMNTFPHNPISTAIAPHAVAGEPQLPPHRSRNARRHLARVQR